MVCVCLGGGLQSKTDYTGMLCRPAKGILKVKGSHELKDRKMVGIIPRYFQGS